MKQTLSHDNDLMIHYITYDMNISRYFAHIPAYFELISNLSNDALVKRTLAKLFWKVLSINVHTNDQFKSFVAIRTYSVRNLNLPYNALLKRTLAMPC